VTGRERTIRREANVMFNTVGRSLSVGVGGLLLSIATLMSSGCQNVPAPQGPAPAVVETRTDTLRGGAACWSSSECGPDEHCSTDDGDCEIRSSCGVDGSYCYDVCTGICVANAGQPPFVNCSSDADCSMWAGCDNCGACRAFSVYDPFPDCVAPEEICTSSNCDGQQAFCDAGQCALRAR
jgi:hypothetical protein